MGLSCEEASLQPGSAIDRRQGKVHLSCITAKAVAGMYLRTSCPSLPALQTVFATSSELYSGLTNLALYAVNDSGSLSIGISKPGLYVTPVVSCCMITLCWKACYGDSNLELCGAATLKLRFITELGVGHVSLRHGYDVVTLQGA